ncbi:MAG: fructosamine kinase family protein [Marinoscillum sp.]
MPIENTFFESALFQATGLDHQIKNITSVPGGDINQAARLITHHDTYFIKYNGMAVGDLFEKEALGLALLAETRTLKIPEVTGQGTAAGNHFLILEYLNQEAPSHNFWEEFGRSLAQLHQHSNEHFGLGHDNHIGRLHQKNTCNSTWVDFFIENRLEVQLGLAIYNDHVDPSFAKKFRQLYAQLPGIFPEEPPALIHGDLWSGNFMCGPNSVPCIYDPAVYYGHREMELAFTRLFGGFDLQFYQSYHETFPLQPNFEDRIDIYNLYPLLVHVNLFGPSYLSGIHSTISRFL